jgi:L-ornithine N5-oxygenase
MRNGGLSSSVDPFDVVGIGFGPSNLALAICARELAPSSNCLFFEQNSRFQWHPGMLFEGARMQISFLKDLVSLRNLASPYTFLQYTKAQGRLEHFVNLGQLRPTRLEYQDYLRWVANHFSDQVSYDAAVRRITPVEGANGSGLCLFRVDVENVSTQQKSVYFAKNVVCGTGGRSLKPAHATSCARRVVHSSEFLLRFPALFADQGRPYVFAVAGAGQSAGEVAAFLLERYEQAQVHMVIPGVALHRTDDNPFVNEHFSEQSANDFYRYSKEKRRTLLQELRATNYGVIREDVLDHLYNLAYVDAVKQRQRLVIHRCARLAGSEERDDRLSAIIEDRFGGPSEELHCDGLVLATGYERSLDPKLFAEVFPFIAGNGSEDVVLSPNCRVKTSPDLRAGFYVQGYGESAFGIGDTLLSLLPFRSRNIVEDIRKHAGDDEGVATPMCVSPSVVRPARADYPPQSFIQDDPERLYTAMERFKFATVISARGADEPVVTEIPLVLDRSRGEKGVLFGHMDKWNPQVELLDGRKVLVLFHGPNAYISPRLSRNNVLPTWNSITVRVHGHVALVRDRSALVRGLSTIAEQSEHDDHLSADDPRIERLLDYIVGFEIKIEQMIGRFKLCQDRSESDRRAAVEAMVKRTEVGERNIIEYLTGLPIKTETVGSGHIA